MKRQQLESILSRAEEKFTGFTLPKDGSKVSRALVVDLSKREFSDFGIPRAWCEKYISGPALAARMWAHFRDDSMNAEDLPVVITTGACASSLMPFSAITSMAFCSPQTGKLAINTISCTFGNKLDSLGYSAMVIIGRNNRIGVIEMTDKGSRIEFSESFLNASPSELSAFYPSAESSVLSTGKAADNGVLFATAVCDGLPTGRGGLGYVFGRKNLKAIIATTRDRGQRKNLTKEKKVAYREIDQACDASRLCREMRKCGTTSTVDGSINSNSVPVCDFSGVRDARLVHLTSHETVGHISSASIACEGCRIGCRLCDASGRELPPASAVMMLGPDTGCCDMDPIADRFVFCIETGMDCVSVGNILGHMHVPQGDVMSRLEDMASGRLAIPEDALRTDGLECGPYDYRGGWANALNACNGRWFEQYFGRFCTSSPVTVAKLVSFNEMLVMGLQSLGLSEACINLMKGSRSTLDMFAIRLFPILSIFRLRADAILKSLSLVLGQTVTMNDVMMVGRRTRTVVDTINGCMDGINVRIPDKFCIDSTGNGVVPFVALAEEYHRQRVVDMMMDEPAVDVPTN